jgi:splicing suppressor protein 51
VKLRELTCPLTLLAPPAIRSTLNPEQTPKPVPGLNTVVRVFVLGARAESSLPPTNWEQLSRMFPKAQLKVYFIGPQAALPRNWTPREVFDSNDDDGGVGEMRAKGAEEDAAEQAASSPSPAAGQTSNSTSTPTASTKPAAASPTTASSTSNATAGSSSSTASTSTGVTAAAPSSSTTLPTQKAHRSLDHLPANSPDRKNYPYTAFEEEKSVAPLPANVDRSTLSSVEGAYGPTFYVPPTPTMTVTRASEFSPAGRDESDAYGVPAFTIPVSQEITLTSIQAPYEHIHDQFGPFDPYSDAFFAFRCASHSRWFARSTALTPSEHLFPPGSPGFGFPSSIAPGQLQVNRDAEWGETLPLVLETKCPLFVTGFSPKDVERDIQALGA